MLSKVVIVAFIRTIMRISKSLLKIGNANTVASLELYKLTINSLDIYKQRLIDDGVTEEEITETREDTLYKVNQISAITQKETELKKFNH